MAEVSECSGELPRGRERPQVLRGVLPAEEQLLEVFVVHGQRVAGLARLSGKGEPVPVDLLQRLPGLGDPRGGSHGRGRGS